MKNIKYLVFTILTFLVFLPNVFASNKIDSINVDIYINKDGSANITEVWDMNVTEGTEVYKPMGSLTNMQLSNFTVTDESGNMYTYLDNWNISGTLENKKYKNGINYGSNIELCWGMGSYGRHTYTVKYTLTNFVFNTSDAQVVYYKAINDSMDPAPKNIAINITSFYDFPDTLDVWGYGYGGYAYVKDGIIELANKEENFKSSHYAVALIKFPSNTFDTINKYSQFPTFDSVLTRADEGAKSSKTSGFANFIEENISGIFWFVIVFISIFAGSKFSSKKLTYYMNGAIARLDKNKVVPFRDVPCKKDLFRANTVAEIFSTKNDSNIIGAILLKWILNDQVSIVNLPDKMFSKNRIGIDLKESLVTTNTNEQEMYNIMKKASRDNILETNEMERWCKSNYNKFYRWFSDMRMSESQKLVSENLLTPRNKTNFDVSANLEKEAIKLFGLKMFLEEFSLIKEKEAIEVKLWREYLIFAQMFGIADKVAHQFKKLYPEIVASIGDENYDRMLHDIVIIDNMSISSVSAANQGMEAAARSYSSGGGGFSSFGGGGGSFGGGSGGGCR